jgi:hypothetical protein
MSVAFPTSVYPERVEVTPVDAVAQFDNPVDLSTEVQALGGQRFEITIRMQLMSAADAAAFGAFLQAVRGGLATFTFDLTPWCPGWSPAPGVRTFRLADPNTAFDGKLAVEFGFTFHAIEDI